MALRHRIPTVCPACDRVHWIVKSPGGGSFLHLEYKCCFCFKRKLIFSRNTESCRTAKLCLVLATINCCAQYCSKCSPEEMSSVMKSWVDWNLTARWFPRVCGQEEIENKTSSPFLLTAQVLSPVPANAFSMHTSTSILWCVFVFRLH